MIRSLFFFRRKYIYPDSVPMLLLHVFCRRSWDIKTQCEIISPVSNSSACFFSVRLLFFDLLCASISTTVKYYIIFVIISYCANTIDICIRRNLSKYFVNST